MEKLRLHAVLKRLLEDRGISMRELSRATKVPEATMSGYLNGSEPGKLQHVRAISKFFGVPMETLLYGDDDRPPTLDEVFTEGIFEGWLKVKIERAVPTKRKSKSDKD